MQSPGPTPRTGAQESVFSASPLPSALLLSGGVEPLILQQVLGKWEETFLSFLSDEPKAVEEKEEKRHQLIFQ